MNPWSALLNGEMLAQGMGRGNGTGVGRASVPDKPIYVGLGFEKRKPKECVTGFKSLSYPRQRGPWLSSNSKIWSFCNLNEFVNALCG